MSSFQPEPVAGRVGGVALARWLVAGAAALGGARGELDDINVFPVADGDTGTNLALTSAAVADAVRPAAESGATPRGSVTAGEVASVAAEAALQGARGNSGVILAAWLRGFADGVAGRADLDGPGLVAALRAAAAGATSAVGRPLEGTILSVAHAAAGAAADVDAAAVDVAAAALAGARTALAATTSQLPALRAAGVVDAGGAGLVVLLEALAGVPRAAAATAPSASGSPAQEPDLRPAPRPQDRPAGNEPGYEVMYLLDAPAEAVPALEDALGVLGDSLVVSGRPGCYRVHVHVDDVGAAIEAAIDVGRPSQISVTRFADTPATRAPSSEVSPTGRAVVAMAHGAGLSALLAAAGATVVEGFELGNPTAGEVVHAIRSTGAGEVVVLPNDAAAWAEANAAAASARSEGLAVRVVPTRSVLQGLAALAVHDAGQPFAEDVVAMTASARSTRSGEIVVADHEALTSAGICAAGQALGVIEGDVALIADDVAGAAVELLDRMLAGGGELVTLLVGPDAPPGLADRLSERITSTRPAVEVEAHVCGQAGHPLLVGVE